MYVGAKAAVENFTRVWAIELTAEGIRVNAIAPGAIDTNIWNVTEQKHRDGNASGILIKRFDAPREAANVTAFLASDEAPYVSGAVDGAQGAA